MSDELSKHPRTRSQYEELSSNLKKYVDYEYEKHKTNTISSLRKMQEKEELTSSELLESFLLPDEERIPGLDPLNVSRYYVISAENPYEREKFIDTGYDMEMYLTNKRLLLVRAGESARPILAQVTSYPDEVSPFNKGERKPTGMEYKVGYTASDSYGCIPFPLNNIYGISLLVQHESSSHSYVKPKQNKGGLAIFGVILLAIGIALGAIFKFEDIWAAVSAVMMVVGIIAVLISLLGNPNNVSEPKKSNRESKEMRLVTLDPVYMTKAAVHIEINIYKHNAKFIAQWARELQNRSQAICDTKVFEKRMVV